MSYIKFESVSKTYRVREKRGKRRDIVGVDNLSFRINKGDIVGYFGANGAGKSTTIKLLSGILVPDSGNILVDGIIPHKNRKEFVKNIGVMFGQKTQLEWDLPLVDSFELLKVIYSISDGNYKSQLSYLSELLGLDAFIKIPVRQLSLGQRIRGEIAATLIHSPRIVFLDEPTIGLDVQVKKQLYKMIQDINRTSETTIIITSHDLTGIEELVNRMLIIDQGILQFDGTVKQLYVREQQRGRLVFIPEESAIFNYKLLDDQGITYFDDNGRIVVKISENSQNAQDITLMIMRENKIREFYFEKPKLEDVLAHLYENLKG